MSEWIDNSKQQPAEDGRYLCFWGSVFIGIYTKSTNSWKREYPDTVFNQTVSHWMSLPGSPK